jgi:hypothetical protein
VALLDEEPRCGSVPDGVIGNFDWFDASSRTMALGSTEPPTGISKDEGKAIPLQALTGPEVSRRLRLPDF